MEDLIYMKDVASKFREKTLSYGHDKIVTHFQLRIEKWKNT